MIFIIGTAIVAGLAGASIAGGIASGAAGVAMSNKAARRQRKHERNMYQHRYQWGMEDMREAGLNPILAYKGIGGGAGSSAMAKVPDLAAGLAGGINAGTKLGKMSQEAQLLRAQTTTAQEQAKAQNALAANQNAEALLKTSALPEAQAVGSYFSTPEGIANRQRREEFGGKGMWPGLGAGAESSAKAIAEKLDQRGRTEPILEGEMPWHKGKRSPYGDNTRKAGSKWGQPWHYYKRKK